MGYIYKITNLINGKCYVGKTIRSIDLRFREHTHKGRKCPKIARAIEKYGVENFKFETIEWVDDCLLSEREIYWITKLDTFKNGYNSTLGGEGTARYDYSRVVELFEQGMTYTEIAKRENISYDSVAGYLRAQPNHIRPTNEIEVIKYDLKGKEVERFKSITEASISIGVDRSNILVVCQRKKKTSGGFQWRYADDCNDIKEEIEYGKRVVECYDSNGKFVKEYDSVVEAAVCVGVLPSAISSCCRGRQNSAGGFQFCYKGDVLIPKKNIRKVIHKRRIVLEKDGKRYEFDSMTNAAHFLNTYKSTICKLDNESIINGYKLIK